MLLLSILPYIETSSPAIQISHIYFFFFLTVLKKLYVLESPVLESVQVCIVDWIKVERSLGREGH